jgi:hypothetical protein
VIGEGYTEFTRFPVVHQKTTRSLVDPQSQGRRPEAATSDQSDRCATAQSGDFEAEDTRRDRMVCVRLQSVRSPGI